MIRTTIPPFPFAQAFADARLDDIRTETYGKRTDLIIVFREICHAPDTPLIEPNDALTEHVRGTFIPHRVRFVGVTLKYFMGEYAFLPQISPDHPARILLGMLTWRLTSENHPSYRLISGSADADLWFSARKCVAEVTDVPVQSADFIRTHSPAPPLNEGLVPHYAALNQRFGGNPITIHLGPRTFHRRLFVGSLETQPDHRPDVDAVLNLGEEPSKWLNADARTASPCDRWSERGEGSTGMSVEEIKAEAQWVIERLRKHQRVLVHCVAGFNRSVTVCVAVLMLLEGLTPEAALARVREHHAWAKPDPVHWLTLKGVGHLND